MRDSPLRVKREKPAEGKEKRTAPEDCPLPDYPLKVKLAHLFLIGTVCLLAYSNTFHSPFIFDDVNNISQNPMIRDFGNFKSYIEGHRFDNSYEFNPRRIVGYLSFALNYRLGGLNAAGYHITNLLIHFANSVLVYMLVLATLKTTLLRAQAEKKREMGILIALSSALVFSAHPVETEAVSYLVQRFTSLCATFYLLSIYLYARGRTLKGTKKRAPFWALSFLSALLAMATKEIAFTLPLMIALYEMIFFRSGIRRKLLIAGLVAASAVAMVFILVNTNQRLALIISDLSAKARLDTDMPRLDYLFTEFRVIVTYIRLIFFPAGQNLDYDYPVYHRFFTPQVFISFLFLMAVLGLGIYMVFRGRAKDGDRFLMLAGFGILWFFAALLIESSVIPIVDVIFEHRLYLPSAGAFIAISTGGFMLAEGRPGGRKAATALLAVIVMALGIGTFKRNEVWGDEVRFWEDVARKSPMKMRPLNNLAAKYLEKGMTTEAIETYSKAMEIKPFPEALNGLGAAYEKAGETGQALLMYEKAARMRPDYAEPWFNMGLALKRAGRYAEAIEKYRKAIQIKPDYAEAYHNLAIALDAAGNHGEAIEDFKKCLSLMPDFAQAYKGLAMAYMNMKRYGEAEDAYMKALSFGRDADVLNNLGVCYKNTGNFEKAFGAFKEALALKPESAALHYNLTALYLKTGDVKSAEGEYRVLARLAPRLAARFSFPKEKISSPR